MSQSKFTNAPEEFQSGYVHRPYPTNFHSGIDPYDRRPPLLEPNMEEDPPTGDRQHGEYSEGLKNSLQRKATISIAPGSCRSKRLFLAEEFVFPGTWHSECNKLDSDSK